MPSGWGWLALVGYGDYLNFVGLCLFALLTAACYVRIVPVLLAHGERLQAAIACLQILVLVAAAIGVFAARG